MRASQSVLRVTESFKVSHKEWRIAYRRLNLGFSSGLTRVNKVTDEGALRNGQQYEISNGLHCFERAFASHCKHFVYRQVLIRTIGD